jgi:acetyltransferase-like isoleucine patch superfamily enzyme
MKYLIKILFLPYKFYSQIKKKILYNYYKMKGAKIGKNTYIGPNVYLDVNHKPGKIIIGSNCYITRNSSLLAHSDALMGGPQAVFKEFGGERIIGDVIIKDNVFVGFHCVILPGVTIGKDAIIGAMSLVNKDVPAGAIVGGVPARIKGSIYSKLNIDKP